DAEQAVDLIGEAAHRVGLIALAVSQAAKMATLAAFGPLIGHLPQHPLIDLVATAHILGVELPHLFGDVHHDRPRLEDADGWAPAERLVVHQGWHAVVRAEL